MRVLLLSAGPSLANYHPDGRCELVIGVNFVAERYPLDWWSVGDDERFERIIPLPGRDGQPVKVFTMDVSADRLEAGGNPGRERFKAHGCLRWSAVEYLHPPVMWSTYSATAGLVLARHLGAKVIEVRGVDMAGNEYCNGSQGAEKAGRWEQERKIWSDLVAWLAAERITVERK